MEFVLLIILCIIIFTLKFLSLGKEYDEELENYLK